jgi:hypothetical protein
VREFDKDLRNLTAQACPALVGIFGAGSDTTGALLLFVILREDGWKVWGVY